MKIVFQSLGGIAAGLLVGWCLPRPMATSPAGENSSEAPAASVVRPPDRRVRESLAGRLPDVAACREQIAAAEKDDGTHPLLRRALYQEALRRWLELDSASAVLEAEKNPSSAFASDLFTAWAELDPVRAMQGMEDASPALSKATMSGFFSTLFIRDPRLAADALSKPAWQKTDSWIYDPIVKQWMLTDPAGALAQFSAPDSETSNPQAGFRIALLTAWAENDFAAVWEKFGIGATDPRGHDENDPILLLSSALKVGSPAALATLGEQFKDGKNIALHIPLARAIAFTDGQVALDLGRQLNGQPGMEGLASELLREAASKFATTDPATALALLEEAGPMEETPGRNSDGLFRECFSSMAASDPVKTLAAIGELPPSRQGSAMSGYLKYAVDSDPDQIAVLAREWLADPERADAFREGWSEAFSWGHGSGIHDPGPLLAAFPELDSAVNHYVLATWSKADPEAGAEWVASHLTDQMPGMVNDSGLLVDLATSAPEFTADWIGQVADVKIQQQAAFHLAVNWLSYNPASAQVWLDGLPEGPVRDAALKGQAAAKLNGKR